MESSGPVSVLVVEDEQASRRALGTLLRRCGYQVELAESAEEALQLLQRRVRPDVVLLDVDLPGMSGLDLLKRLRKLFPEVVPVLLTGADRERVWSATSGGVDYLRKPINFDHLRSVIDRRTTRV